MKSPLVSILIPVYNREKLIGETIESAINQTYKNIEIIIVDNNSTDKTWEILKSYSQEDKRIKIYRNEENIGPVRNWKRCLEYAQGEYAKFLWSDDLIAPEFVEKALPYLINNSDVGFVFTGAIEIDEEGKYLTRWHFIGENGIYDSMDFIKGSLIGENFPNSPGCALFRTKDIRKNLIINIPNKINNNFASHAIGNDVLLFLLTAKDYPKFAFINAPLSYFRAHKESITKLTLSVELNLLYFMAKAYFVENYIQDKELKKRFNSRILLALKKNSLGINNIKDFYFEVSNISIDYKDLIRLSLIKAIRFLKRQINK